MQPTNLAQDVCQPRIAIFFHNIATLRRSWPNLEKGLAPSQEARQSTRAPGTKATKEMTKTSLKEKPRQGTGTTTCASKELQ
jgi:hypothetical protein